MRDIYQTNARTISQTIVKIRLQEVKVFIRDF